MFAAPLIFIQLLRHHVLLPSATAGAALGRLASLGAIVVAVFALSLGPFLGQVSQLHRSPGEAACALVASVG